MNFTSSNGFSTGWSPTNATTSTAGAVTDPFGGSSSWNLTEDSTNNAHFITKGFTAFVGLPYVTSIYAKANTRNFVVINLFDNANRRAWFNLSNGTIGTTDAGVTASIQSIGNGWYRCSLSLQFYDPTNYTNTIRTDIIVPTTAGANSIYVWGLQLEIGSFATSFDYRDYARELIMCQRYYEKSYDQGTTPGTNTTNGVSWIVIASVNSWTSVPFAAEKRVVPTMSVSMYGFCNQIWLMPGRIVP